MTNSVKAHFFVIERAHIPRHQTQMKHKKSILLEKYSSDHANEDIVRLRIY